MKTVSIFTCITTASIACAASAAAGTLPEGLYIKADAGGTLTEDTTLREFFGPVAPNTKVKFDPGARFGVGVGYDLCAFFAVEGEFGAMANSISSISGADRVDAVLSNVPFLVNVKLQLPKNQFCITPYIGGGVGGSASILEVDHIDYNDTHLHGSEGDIVFAYQAFGGLRYALNDRIGLKVEYRFFGTEAPDWKASDAFGTDTDHMKFGKIRTHSLSVAFDWSF